MHICEALVVCCIDFRFQKFIRTWTDENLKDKTFDLVGFAGATKDLDTVMKQIRLSVKLHQIKEVILIHHEECGAYGDQSTPENHAADLKKAKVCVLKEFPGVSTRGFYLHLDGTFDQVV